MYTNRDALHEISYGDALQWRRWMHGRLPWLQVHTRH
jgi:hypothetical protein